MFLDSSGTVLAIDAASGDTLWSFVRPAKASLIGPPVTQPRGIAIFENSLYVPTSDNHMIALDTRTGKVQWDHLITGMQGTLRPTAAPIVVHGKVIEGMSGCAGVGEPGGCFIVGLDAKTGEELWRFHTIARAGEKDGDTWNGAPTKKRFGGSVWSSGTYDSENNLVYFGTGQTYHIVTLMEPDPTRRPENSALYTNTTLALNPDTGKLLWHYQHIARDVWDLDWSFERIITTLTVNGKPRKVVMTVGKLGILDALDAGTGKYLFSHDMGYQNLVTAIDPKTGWKTTNPAFEPDPKQPKFLCPFPIGVRNWPATSYNPVNHLLYVGAADTCMDFTWLKGEDFDITYGVKPRPGGDGNIGTVTAINLETRKTEWAEKHRAQESSAILATAGGLVFEGGRDRVFRASDSVSGKTLWQLKLDNPPSAMPISFSHDGIQYIAITTGGGNPNDLIAKSLTPEIEDSRPGTTLWLFKLGDAAAAK
jgi:alcohol dehydrogenase (cytochrome c)